MNIRNYRKWFYPIPYILPFAFLVVLFIYIPVGNSFLYSLTRWDGVSRQKVFVGLSNYINAFKNDDVFLRCIRNNIIYLVASFLTNNLGGLILAVLIHQWIISRLHSKIITTFYFTPNVVSMVAVGYLWRYIYNPFFGLLNTFFKSLHLEGMCLDWLGNPSLAIYSICIASAWRYIGFSTVVYLAGLQSIPNMYYEAASLDGASKAVQFRRISVPLLRETISVLAVISIVGSFQIFDLVFVMTRGGPMNSSEVMGTWLYRQAFVFFKIGYGSSIAIVLFFVIFIISFIFMKLRSRVTIEF